MPPLKFQPPETAFDPGAITSGSPVTRDVELVFGSYPFPYRTSLTIDNRSAATLTLRANGRTRLIGPGAVLKTSSRELGPLRAYTVDADANTSAGQITIYENGGLSGAD